MRKNVIASAAAVGGLVAVLTVGGVAGAAGAATPTSPTHAASADAARIHQWARAHRSALRHQGIDVSASTIGIAPQELRTALAAGASIAEVAASHGSSATAVESALDRAATSALGSAVSAGTLSSTQASAIEAKLPARIDALVTRVF